jgi:hypothetical protein
MIKAIPFIFCFLIACNFDSIPENVVDEDLMVHILVDVHLIESDLATMSYGDTLFQHGANHYQYVFNKYSIDSTVFRESMIYYTHHPEVLNKIYDKVLEEYSKMEAQEN